MNEKLIERIESKASNKGYMDDSDITGLLGISQRTLNNKVCRGDDLPKYIKPRGCRRRIWPTEAVQEWLSSTTTGAAE